MCAAGLLLTKVEGWRVLHHVAKHGTRYQV